ncbi:MAG: hypothetical protein HY687_00685 [Chloroflexi bacterium]|nr:hypothetical protein [Chloroflexota bacterium]
MSEGEEIKVVIALKGGRGSIGVQAPLCDPLFAVLEGGLAEALARAPALVEEARHRWATSPRYPQCESPLPAPTPPAAAPPARGRPARAPQQRE